MQTGTGSPILERMSHVRQNPALSRFELDADGHTAFASYKLSDGVLLMTHTETPPALRGRGIGERLVLGALGQARQQGLKVNPLCSFVRFVISKHPEFQNLTT